MADAMTLPAIDWTGVSWDGARDAPIACSVCAAAIGEDQIPLTLWRQGRLAARFCEACQWLWLERRAGELQAP